MSANWLPVPEHKIPSPRPGACTNDTKALSDANLNFIKKHSLMDEPVPPFFGSPILIRTGLISRFTTIAVDPQVGTTEGKTFDIIFVGTTRGRVIKVINAQAADSKYDFLVFLRNNYKLKKINVELTYYFLDCNERKVDLWPVFKSVKIPIIEFCEF